MWLSVAAGVAAFAALSVRLPRAQEVVRAEGTFWVAEDSEGSVVSSSRNLGGVTLDEGDVLGLKALPDGFDWSVLRLDVQKLAQPALLQIDLAPRGGKDLVLAVMAEEPISVYVAERSADRASEILQRAEVSNRLKNSFERYRIAIQRTGDRADVLINGEAAITVTDERIGSWTPRVSVLNGIYGIRGIFVASAIDGRAHTLHDDLSALSPQPPWREGVRQALGATVAAILAGLYLRCICLGRPRLIELCHATAAWATLPALCCVVALFIPFSSLVPPLALSAAAGLPLALVSLRQRLRQESELDPRRSARQLLVTVLLLTVATGVVIRARGLADETTATTPDLMPGASEPAEPVAIAGPTPLDLANALVIPGNFRNAEVSGEVSLASNSLLEVRLQSDPSPSTKGMALWIASDTRLPCSFVRETATDCSPSGTTTSSVASDAFVPIHIRAAEGSFEAQIGDASVAATSRPMPGSDVVLMAVRGTAMIRGLTVRALPASAEGGSASGAAFTDAMIAGGWLSVMLLMLSVGPWLSGLFSWSRSIELGALALIPVVVGVTTWSDDSHISVTELGVAAWVTVILLLLPVFVHARRVAVARLMLVVVFVGIVAPLVTSAYATTGRGASALLTPANDYTPDERMPLHADLAYFQHHLLRRLNDYLASHRFRGREFSLVKPPNTLRVVTLGGSSTWGYGLPESEQLEYPAILEGLLNAASDSTLPRVEVLNAAWRGATGVRLFHFLRDALLSFQPDVVTLSLTYNDAFALTSIDEQACFDSLTATAQQGSLLQDLQLAWRVMQGGRVLNRLLVAFPKWHGTTSELWISLGGDPAMSAPIRFEAMLRNYSDLARRAGFELIFIKEPLAGDHRMIWKEEFSGLIDRVGSEYGLRVIDPTPELQAAGGSSLFQDAVHPRAAGHAVIANSLVPAIRDAMHR